MTESQLVARIPMEMREALAKVADADDRPMSYHVRQAIKEYLDRRQAEAVN